MRIWIGSESLCPQKPVRARHDGLVLVRRVLKQIASGRLNLQVDDCADKEFSLSQQEAIDFAKSNRPIVTLSSGTTGLRRVVAGVAKDFFSGLRFGGRDCKGIFSNYPLDSTAGIQTLLQCLVLDVDLVLIGRDHFLENANLKRCSHGAISVSGGRFLKIEKGLIRSKLRASCSAERYLMKMLLFV